jgi:hypothetical protein
MVWLTVDTLKSYARVKKIHVVILNLIQDPVRLTLDSGSSQE